jgi:hypothetical protein
LGFDEVMARLIAVCGNEASDKTYMKTAIKIKDSESKHEEEAIYLTCTKLKITGKAT